MTYKPTSSTQTADVARVSEAYKEAGRPPGEAAWAGLFTVFWWPETQGNQGVEPDGGVG